MNGCTHIHPCKNVFPQHRLSQGISFYTYTQVLQVLVYTVPVCTAILGSEQSQDFTLYAPNASLCMRP